MTGQLNWKAEVTYSPRLRGAHIPPEVVCALSEGQVSLAWTPAEGVVCLATAKRGNDNSPFASCACYP